MSEQEDLVERSRKWIDWLDKTLYLSTAVGRKKLRVAFVDLRSLTDEFERLREKNSELNRRAQAAEAGVEEKASSGGSLGRMLANVQASRLREEVERLRPFEQAYCDALLERNERWVPLLEAAERVSAEDGDFGSLALLDEAIARCRERYPKEGIVREES